MLQLKAVRLDISKNSDFFDVPDLHHYNISTYTLKKIDEILFWIYDRRITWLSQIDAESRLEEFIKKGYINISGFDYTNNKKLSLFLIPFSEDHLQCLS